MKSDLELTKILLWSSREAERLDLESKQKRDIV
jgi:hypothetical protein